MDEIILYSVGALAVRGVRRAVFGRPREERLAQEVSSCQWRWFCAAKADNDRHVWSCHFITSMSAMGASYKAVRLARVIAEVSMPASVPAGGGAARVLGAPSQCDATTGCADRAAGDAGWSLVCGSAGCCRRGMPAGPPSCFTTHAASNRSRQAVLSCHSTGCVLLGAALVLVHACTYTTALTCQCFAAVAGASAPLKRGADQPQPHAPAAKRSRWSLFAPVKCAEQHLAWPVPSTKCPSHVSVSTRVVCLR